MGSMRATADDMRRWREEGRKDILRHAAELPNIKGADLWIHPTTGVELTKCPFVRNSGSRYICKIYDTRPEVCRGYPYSYAQMVYVGCEIPVQIEGQEP